MVAMLAVDSLRADRRPHRRWEPIAIADLPRCRPMERGSLRKP